MLLDFSPMRVTNNNTIVHIIIHTIVLCVLHVHKECTSMQITKMCAQSNPKIIKY